MKKYILPLFFLFFGICSLNAQVGIGTVNPQAQLDVVTDATATSERKGIQVDLNSTSTAQQNTYSLHLTNSSSPSLTASKYGIFSNVSGAGTATRYGVYSEVFQPSSNPTGTHLFGVYSLLGLSTGVNKNAYGFYADITNVNNTANIYGVYSTVAGTVANQDVYSGYFLGGKFSIGQTTTDNYILPPSRGTNGQIMETDGAGNVSWVDKNRAVSTIPIYGNGTYVMNNGSGQDLNGMDTALEPSIYNASGNIEVKLIVRYTGGSGTNHLQLRAHRGGAGGEVYPIVTADAWTFAGTQTGGVATSPWKTWSAGTDAYEVHVHGWNSTGGSLTIVSAYLLVRSQ